MTAAPISGAGYINILTYLLPGDPLAIAVCLDDRPYAFNEQEITA